MALANGLPPNDPEVTVRAADAEAETYAARCHPSKPDDARAERDASAGLGGALKPR